MEVLATKKLPVMLTQRHERVKVNVSRLAFRSGTACKEAVVRDQELCRYVKTKFTWASSLKTKTAQRGGHAVPECRFVHVP
jgi:hypothetical protein